MNHNYWSLFGELIRTPFLHLELIWGIVPLYFGLLLNEMTSTKANFRTALQTGFSFLWAGAQWLYPYVKFHGITEVELNSVSPINLAVTSLVLGFGAVAFGSGHDEALSALRQFSRPHALCELFHDRHLPDAKPDQSLSIAVDVGSIDYDRPVRRPNLVGFALRPDADPQTQGLTYEIEPRIVTEKHG
jgi:hypothetical protein